MARLRFVASAEGTEIALSAATAKTVLQVTAPANQVVAVRSMCVTFDSTSSSAEPAIIDILYQTTAGTMTSVTPRKEDPGRNETIQSTAQKNATAEPTAGVVLRSFHVHPQAGYERVFNFDEEILIQGGDRLGMRITAPAAVNCLPAMVCEE